MRALISIVLVGLIGAGTLYVLSGAAGGADSGQTSIAATLKEITSRVVLPSSGGESDGIEASQEPRAQGLSRWFSKGEGQAAPLIKDVYYQYVDDAGTVHFVQKLADVPTQWQDRAGRIEVERTAPTLGRQAARPASRRRAAAPATVSRPEVVVYTTSWCGWCRKTLAFLDERGVHYVNKDIEANPGHRDELIQKTGRSSIPVVEIDGQIIRGYNAERMDQLLARSG